MFVLFVMRSYLIEVRGLKLDEEPGAEVYSASYLIEVRGLKPATCRPTIQTLESYLIEVRGLKRPFSLKLSNGP